MSRKTNPESVVREIRRKTRSLTRDERGQYHQNNEERSHSVIPLLSSYQGRDGSESHFFSASSWNLDLIRPQVDGTTGVVELV